MNRKERRAAAKGSGTSRSRMAAGEPPDQLFARALRRHEAGQLAEAESLYRRGLQSAPFEAEIHYNLGIALAQQNRPREAIDAWREALALKPRYPRALNNLGMTLAQQGALDEAETALREALAAAPDVPEIASNLAGVLSQQGRGPQAEAAFRRALILQPAFADAFNTLGTCLAGQRKTGQAITAYRRALAADPQHAKAHFNLSLALLASGNLREGWAEHEWRWRGGARALAARRFTRPPWQGEDIRGKRILLHGEQGFGDSLQFVRFARPIAALGAHVLLEVPAALTRLLARVEGVAEVIAQGQPLPRFDCHLPLLSAPHRLGTTLGDIPAQTPYLFADAEARTRWQERLASLPRPWVGLVWAGDSRINDPLANAIDRRRSAPLAAFAPLLQQPGVSFISLQKGAPARQIADLPEHLRPCDWTAELGDFADTAALTDNLDLVITVDTAVAHLAGALAKPVWIASRFDGCWRWLEDRDDSPWYPTARLFRQPAPAAWDSVIDAMAPALVRFGQERRDEQPVGLG